MKTLTENVTASTKDFSSGKDGSSSVDVDYSFSYDVLETAAELEEHFSTADLIKLANNKNKALANSAARAKAVAPYAQDPNSPEAVKNRMVNDLMKLGKSEAEARALVESI